MLIARMLESMRDKCLIENVYHWVTYGKLLRISKRITHWLWNYCYLRIMFRVDHLDELLSRLVKHGAEMVGEVVNYENIYRLCYIRGTEGLLIGLAEQLGNETARDILENK
jgi:hypothetical protein